jgi:predicted membrane protein
MQTPPISATAVRQAQERQLGVPLRQYRGNVTNFLSLLAGLVMLVLVLILMCSAPTSLSAASSGESSSTALLIPFVFLFPFVLLFLSVALWPMLYTYYVCTEGLLGMRVKKVVLTLPWSEIARVVKKKQKVNYLPWSTTYQVFTRQGKEYTVYSLPLFDERKQ